MDENSFFFKIHHKQPYGLVHIHRQTPLIHCKSSPVHFLPVRIVLHASTKGHAVL